MNTLEIKQAIKDGKCVFGTSVTGNSPYLPQVLRGAGLDFVFLDTEHVPRDRQTLSDMCYIYRGIGLAPLVRIGPQNPEQARQALDGGAAMIVAPYIESAEQVKELTGATKLRPIQGKRLQEVLSGERPLEDEILKLVNQRNEKTILLVNIESVHAIENLESILSVPGLDGTQIGPNDLSWSLGIPNQYDNPRFLEAVETIVTKTREKGLIAAAHFVNCGPIEMAKKWMDFGVNMMIKDTDVNYILDGLKHEVSALRQEEQFDSDHIVI